MLRLPQCFRVGRSLVFWQFWGDYSDISTSMRENRINCIQILVLEIMAVLWEKEKGHARQTLTFTYQTRLAWHTVTECSSINMGGARQVRPPWTIYVLHVYHQCMTTKPNQPTREEKVLDIWLLHRVIYKIAFLNVPSSYALLFSNYFLNYIYSHQILNLHFINNTGLIFYWHDTRNYHIRHIVVGGYGAKVIKWDRGRKLQLIRRGNGDISGWSARKWKEERSVY